MIELRSSPQIHILMRWNYILVHWIQNLTRSKGRESVGPKWNSIVFPYICVRASSLFDTSQFFCVNWFKNLKTSTPYVKQILDTTPFKFGKSLTHATHTYELSIHNHWIYFFTCAFWITCGQTLDFVNGAMSWKPKLKSFMIWHHGNEHQPFIAPGETRDHLLQGECSRLAPHIIIWASRLAWRFLYISRRDGCESRLDFDLIWRRTMLRGDVDPCRRSLNLDRGGKFSCPWMLLILRIHSLE